MSLSTLFFWGFSPKHALLVEWWINSSYLAKRSILGLSHEHDYHFLWYLKMLVARSWDHVPTCHDQCQLPCRGQWYRDMIRIFLRFHVSASLNFSSSLCSIEIGEAWCTRYFTKNQRVKKGKVIFSLLFAHKFQHPQGAGNWNSDIFKVLAFNAWVMNVSVKLRLFLESVNWSNAYREPFQAALTLQCKCKLYFVIRSVKYSWTIEKACWKDLLLFFFLVHISSSIENSWSSLP